MDPVELEEDLRHLVDVGLGRALVSVSHHLGEVYRCLRVHRHDLPQDSHKVGCVVLLLAVGHDLVKLAGLYQALDDLVGATALLIDVKGHLRVGSSDEVAKLVTHGQLLLLDPALKQLELVLGDDWLGKLDGLDLVEFGRLEQRVEIDENRRR